jgi:hypothetical protein
MVEIVAFVTGGGKFPIPSTSAYQKQHPAFYEAQEDALVEYGGLKFGESCCSSCCAAGGCNMTAGSGGGWVCPPHPTAAGTAWTSSSQPRSTWSEPGSISR